MAGDEPIRVLGRVKIEVWSYVYRIESRPWDCVGVARAYS